METNFRTTSYPIPPSLQPFLCVSDRPGTALPRPRVLLADDNRQMRLLLSIYLEDAGYDVMPCRDGFDLVEHLGSYLLPNATESYDLIISDIRMPHLSGLDVLEGLRERDDFPPMILITAFGDAEAHERARQLGAAAFFDKPFSVEDLVARVRELVPLESPGSTE
jgi:DNA-binding response OmpR family regulator